MLSRREFFRFLSISAIGSFAIGRVVLAAAKKVELPAGKTAVPESDTVAKSLGYKEDTKKVEQSKYPAHKADQSCKKCVFFKKVNDGWGECQVIKAGLVATGGWCASFNLAAGN